MLGGLVVEEGERRVPLHGELPLVGGYWLLLLLQGQGCRLQVPVLTLVCPLPFWHHLSPSPLFPRLLLHQQSKLQHKAVLLLLLRAMVL